MVTTTPTDSESHCSPAGLHEGCVCATPITGLTASGARCPGTDGVRGHGAAPARVTLPLLATADELGTRSTGLTAGGFESRILRMDRHPKNCPLQTGLWVPGKASTVPVPGPSSKPPHELGRGESGEPRHCLINYEEAIIEIAPVHQAVSHTGIIEAATLLLQLHC